MSRFESFLDNPLLIIESLATLHYKLLGTNKVNENNDRLK